MKCYQKYIHSYCSIPLYSKILNKSIKRKERKEKKWNMLLNHKNIMITVKDYALEVLHPEMSTQPLHNPYITAIYYH